MRAVASLTQSSSSQDTHTVYTSSLFSPQDLTFHSNIALDISPITGLITSIHSHRLDPSIPISPPHIDLRDHTVLPGFVDAHTHIFLHAYSEASSLNQERDESLVERILRAGNHCRAALKAGYTTYRDLGTEGVFDADIGVRDAINRGIVPGPRLLVATEPLASSDSYAARYESRLNGTTIQRLADPCDGVDGVTAAVRRRIGAGADLVKFYAEYRRRTLRFPPPAFPGGPDILHPPVADQSRSLLSVRNPSLVMWNQAEMDAIVLEAKRAKAPVAAHAIEPEGVIMAAKAGVTTVDHGWVPSDEALEAMKEAGCIWVPTLSVNYTERAALPPGYFETVLKHVHSGFLKGIPLATGGDTGAFPHGDNVLEMELMVKAGIPVVNVLRAATLGGYEACGGEWSSYRFGQAQVGWRADLVALDGDPRVDFGAVRRVRWVIKDGRVMVRDGRLVE